MDEKTEKIDVIVDEDGAVAAEGGPVEARKPRRRAACAGGAAALAAMAVACALMMQPADAVEVEGFAARAIIPQIPVGLDWAPQGESADEALPETGGAEDAASGSPAQAAPQGGSSSGSAAQPQQQPSQQAPAASQPSAPAHEHSWQPVTEQRWVVDKAAWDEPKYENQSRSICNGCGKDITGNPAKHLEAAGRGSACSGYHSGVVRVQVGTIHHDEQGHYESVTTGYKCSCGATK